MQKAYYVNEEGKEVIGVVLMCNLSGTRYLIYSRYGCEWLSNVFLEDLDD